jgi:hypothetical protein
MKGACPACGYAGHLTVAAVDYDLGEVSLALASDAEKFYVGQRITFTARRRFWRRVADVFRAARMAWRRP